MVDVVKEQREEAAREECEEIRVSRRHAEQRGKEFGGWGVSKAEAKYYGIEAEGKDERAERGDAKNFCEAVEPEWNGAGHAFDYSVSADGVQSDGCGVEVVAKSRYARGEPSN